MLVFPTSIISFTTGLGLAHATSEQNTWYGDITINLSIIQQAIKITSAGTGPFSFTVGNDGTISGTGSISQNVKVSGIYKGTICDGTGLYVWNYNVSGIANQSTGIANLIFTFTSSTVQGDVSCQGGGKTQTVPLQNTQVNTFSPQSISINLIQGASSDSTFLGVGDLKIELTGTNSLSSYSPQTRQQPIIQSSPQLATNNSTQSSNIQIPSWVKNNAKWWAEGQIEDSEFIKGMQYLIQQGIVIVSPTQVNSQTSQVIPSWIKNNAKWWAEGQIGDSDFVKGIQYLIQNGIISISLQSAILDSSTQTISDKGGSITLSGGSGISVPSGAFPTGQTLTLSLLSSLPSQPPSGIIIGVGPALSISFGGSQQTSYESNIIPSVSGQVQPSGNLQVILKAGDISSIPAEEGSVGIADVVDLQGKDHFVGVPENCDSGGSCTFAITSSVASNSQKLVLSQANLNTMTTGEIAPRFGSMIWNGQQFVAYPQGFDPTKKTLVLTHGILSSVQNAYGGCINDIMTAGGYQQVIGFNYDYTQKIEDAGKNFTDVLNMLNKNGLTQVDVMAHSYGTLVSLYASSQTNMKINNMVLEGGPLNGSPVSSTLISTILSNSPRAVAEQDLLYLGLGKTLQDALNSGMIYEAQPDSPNLKQIKNRAIDSHNVNNFIKVAGSIPDPKLEGLAWTILTGSNIFNGETNDGVASIASACSSNLPGPTCLVLPLDHTKLTCDPSVIKDIGLDLGKTPSTNNGKQTTHNSTLVPPSTLTTSSLQIQTHNQIITDNQHWDVLIATASGGSPPYHFQLGTSPNGGTISFGMTVGIYGHMNGTPTSDGQYNFDVCVYDVAGKSDCAPVTVTVLPHLNISVSSATCIVNTYCSVPFVTATGGHPHYHYKFNEPLAGSLVGMGIDASGNLIGTPMREGQYNVDVCVVDSYDISDCTQATITVNSNSSNNGGGGSTGDLTGTWSGSYQDTVHGVPGGDCNVSGTTTLTLTQNGNTITGNFATSGSSVTGGPCSGTDEIVIDSIRGTVTGSQFTFSGREPPANEDKIEMTAQGSFTNNSMQVNFKFCDYSANPCESWAYETGSFTANKSQ